MLFMHETHKVIGRYADQFEALYRERVMGAIAQSDKTRLLWYFNHAMGSGPAYQVVTVTGVASGEAWQAHAERMLSGDLSEVTAQLDSFRYQVEGKMLAPVSWSALQQVELGSVPTEGREHELTLYMQDTGWPDASLDDYIDLWDKEYWQHMRQTPHDQRLLDVQACFQVSHGTGIRPEAILLQKVVDTAILGGLLTRFEKADPTTWPGSYMARSLDVRDQWESKLLRTSRWSPLW
jgi:predicted SnoaL-like aldol condensation-catalyzing enzyme